MLSHLAAGVLSVLALTALADEPRLLTDREAVRPALPEEDDAFAFVVFGDRTGGDAIGINVLKQAVKDTNLLDPDFVMTVGDLVQGYNTTPVWMVQAGEFIGVMDGLDMPWFPVAGNHDIYWRGPGRPETEHEDNFERIFGPLWYAFDHKDCRFIVLFTDEGDPKTGRRNFSTPSAQRMSKPQRDWLRSTLDAAADKRHVFVFLHHPRWRGGGYGDDWKSVHDLLVEAGNVTAVFAGHVHQLRHDGVIDGIQYLSLATVGGHLPRQLPQGGWLDHSLQVMVRDDAITMAALPVGGVLDPADYSPEHLARVEAMRSLRGTISGSLEESPRGLHGDGMVGWTNTMTIPLQIDVALTSADARWTFTPDHAHVTIEPGATGTVHYTMTHADGLDGGWSQPTVTAIAKFTAGSRRWSVPLRTQPLPTPLEVLPGRWRPAALDVPGAGGLKVFDMHNLSDGPFTLECWVKPRALHGRRGLVTKTENSEYGLFVDDAKPHASLHVEGAYVNARSAEPLSMHDWHHVAMVFDGAELRLYVDGALQSKEAASGRRTRNELPLVIGGDVDGAGDIMSSIDGLVDGVRVSNTARYAGDRITPPKRLQVDAATVLLMDMDARRGPFVPSRDRSTRHVGVITAPASTVQDEDAAD